MKNTLTVLLYAIVLYKLLQMQQRGILMEVAFWTRANAL